MKKCKAFILGLVLVVPAAGFANPAETQIIETYTVTSEPDGVDVLIDIPFRVVGVAGTVVGTGLFLVTSPLCGLATAIRPNNAILKCAETLVVEPAKWTFVRPMGMGPIMPGHGGNTYGHYDSRRDWKK